jgi:hypothetical protein
MKSFFGVNIIDDVHCTGHADSVASRSIYYAGQEECTFSAVHVAVEAVLVRLGSVRALIFVHLSYIYSCSCCSLDELCRPVFHCDAITLL